VAFYKAHPQILLELITRNQIGDMPSSCLIALNLLEVRITSVAARRPVSDVTACRPGLVNWPGELAW
jgi:hypothetical protein